MHEYADADASRTVLRTPADVARLTKVSRETVYREIGRGEPAVHVGRQLRIDPTEYPAEPSLDPEYLEMKERIRQEMYVLLTDPSEAPAPKRQRSLLDRELRRQCDRMRLEAALGFDTDLIERLGA